MAKNPALKIPGESMAQAYSDIALFSTVNL
jgi:hypothetical protein